nr:uncharacterized protein LOC105873989 [Microcebus murinus]
MAAGLVGHWRVHIWCFLPLPQSAAPATTPRALLSGPCSRQAHRRSRFCPQGASFPLAGHTDSLSPAGRPETEVPATGTQTPGWMACEEDQGRGRATGSGQAAPSWPRGAAHAVLLVLIKSRLLVLVVSPRGVCVSGCPSKGRVRGPWSPGGGWPSTALNFVFHSGCPCVRPLPAASRPSRAGPRPPRPAAAGCAFHLSSKGPRNVPACSGAGLGLLPHRRGALAPTAQVPMVGPAGAQPATRPRRSSPSPRVVTCRAASQWPPVRAPGPQHRPPCLRSLQTRVQKGASVCVKQGRDPTHADSPARGLAVQTEASWASWDPFRKIPAPETSVPSFQGKMVGFSSKKAKGQCLLSVCSLKSAGRTGTEAHGLPPTAAARTAWGLVTC